MPQLLIMRHAKSDWNSGPGPDRERPLASRGVKAAKRVGRYLSASGQVPDLVLTSPALRACTTVELAAEAGGWSCPVRQVDLFYGAAPEEVVEVLQGVRGAERLLVAGHEPTWSGLVSLLVGGGRVRMPTAAVACVFFVAGSWREVAAGRGELRWLMIPRVLKRLL